jgi:electron-transferring-flavoprotein dehydrogenase
VWKNTVGDELLRNITFADIVADYGPDEWDETFQMTNRLLSDGSDGSLIKGRLSGGISGMKLLAKYKKTKRSLRKNGYVQVREDDYVV